MVLKSLSQETGWIMLSFTKIGKTEGWNIVRFFCGKGVDGISEQRGPGREYGKQKQSVVVKSKVSGTRLLGLENVV